MSSGNVGSEETKNPKILWPESNMYGGETHKNESKHGVVVWLAIYLYSFEWMVDSQIREVQRAWAASRYQGRQRGRGSAAGRTTQRGEMTRLVTIKRRRLCTTVLGKTEGGTDPDGRKL